MSIGIPGQGDPKASGPMKTWYTLNNGTKTMIDTPEPAPKAVLDSGTEDTPRPIVTLGQSNPDILHELAVKLELLDADSQIRILKALWYYFHMDSRV